jgi:hypothetical protein
LSSLWPPRLARLCRPPLHCPPGQCSGGRQRNLGRCNALLRVWSRSEKLIFPGLHWRVRAYVRAYINMGFNTDLQLRIKTRSLCGCPIPCGTFSGSWSNNSPLFLCPSMSSGIFGGVYSHPFHPPPWRPVSLATALHGGLPAGEWVHLDVDYSPLPITLHTALHPLLCSSYESDASDKGKVLSPEVSAEVMEDAGGEEVLFNSPFADDPDLFHFVSVLLILSAPRGPPLLTFSCFVFGCLRGGARDMKCPVWLVSQLSLSLPSRPLLKPRVVPSGNFVATCDTILCRLNSGI